MYGIRLTFLREHQEKDSRMETFRRCQLTCVQRDSIDADEDSYILGRFFLYNIYLVTQKNVLKISKDSVDINIRNRYNTQCTHLGEGKKAEVLKRPKRRPC